jgi:hypothetical protein
MDLIAGRPLRIEQLALSEILERGLNVGKVVAEQIADHVGLQRRDFDPVGAPRLKLLDETRRIIPLGSGSAIDVLGVKSARLGDQIAEIIVALRRLIELEPEPQPDRGSIRYFCVFFSATTTVPVMLG